MLDALAEHHLVEDLSSRHAHERMVHCGLAVGLQWLDIAVVLAVEGGRRPRSRRGRLCGRRSGALGAFRIVLDDFLGGRVCGPAEGRDGGAVGGGGKGARALERRDGA